MKPQTCSQIEPLESRIAPATLVVNSLDPSGSGTLANEIAHAQNGDVIVFQKGLSGSTFITATMDLSASIQIIGNGKVTVNGKNDPSNILTIEPGVTVSISGLNFAKGNNSSGFGGAIDSEGNLTLSNCAFISNTAEDGGAIHQASIIPHSLVLNQCQFYDNTATDSGGGGGAIEFDGTKLLVTGCSFIGNFTAGVGGAILGGGVTKVQGSYFGKDVADLGGGAIYGSNAKTLSVAYSTFTNDEVTQSNSAGGAISASGMGLFSLVGNDFTGNTADSGAYGDGGVFSNNNAQVVISGCNFINNTASQFAALQIYDTVSSCTKAVISGTKFVGNYCSGGLGALEIDDETNVTVQISGCVIKGNNSLDDVAGAYFYTTVGGKVKVVSSVIADNASSSGNIGGLYINGTVSIVDSVIKGNTVVGNGAGVYIVGGTVTVQDCTIANNGSTDGDGGGFYVNAGATLNLQDSIIRYNAALIGGGVYLVGGSTFHNSGNLFTGNVGGNISP